MKRIGFLIFFAVLLSACSHITSEEEKWQSLYKDQTIDAYFKPSFVKDVPNSSYMFVTVVDNGLAAQNYGANFASIQTQYIVDCAEKMFFTVGYILYTEKFSQGQANDYIPTELKEFHVANSDRDKLEVALMSQLCPRN